MGDKLKVFNKGAVMTAANVTNGDELVLLQNTSTTQAYIKVVTVFPDKSSVEPSLYLGENKLHSFKTLTKGSEFVGEDEKLYYKLDVPLVNGTVTFTDGEYQSAVSTTLLDGYIPLGLVSGNSYPLRITDEALMIQEHGKYVENSLPKALAVAAMSTDTAFVYQYKDKIFKARYDGNNGTDLQYCTITNGVAGPWVNLDTTSYAMKVLDTLNKNAIYYIKSSTWNKLDLDTLLETTFGSAGATTSTYAHSSFCNGKLFYKVSNGSSTSLRIKDIETQATNSHSSATPFLVSSNGGIATTYNPTEDKYYVLSWSGASYKIHTITTAEIDSGIGLLTYLGSTQLDGVITRRPDSQYIHGDSNGKFYMVNTSGHPCIVSVVGGVFTLDHEATNRAVTAGCGFFVDSIQSFTSQSPINASVNIKDGDILLDVAARVTGVAITED
jgi:hypothetical protein